MKGELRFVLMENGVQCVMTHGTTMMLKLCVDNQDTQQMVCIDIFTDYTHRSLHLYVHLKTNCEVANITEFIWQSILINNDYVIH